MWKGAGMILTIKEAAARLGCTPSSLYLAVQQGRIAHVRVLGRIGVEEKEVVRYAASLGRRNGYARRERHQDSSSPACLSPPGFTDEAARR